MAKMKAFGKSGGGKGSAGGGKLGLVQSPMSPSMVPKGGKMSGKK